MSTSPLHKILNYILKVLCPDHMRKALSVEGNPPGRPESHPPHIYRVFRRSTGDDCLEAVLISSVYKLHEAHASQYVCRSRKRYNH
jgi:hypothetical protein